MRATMLLCDAAEQVDGKLYVLGGGWNQAVTSEPINMALAVVIEVPWDHAGRPLTVRAALVDEDGREQMAADAHVEVGRPSEAVKPGSELNVPIALRFNGLALAPGRYSWLLTVDGNETARCTFAVLRPE